MPIKFTEQALKQLSVPAGARDQQWFDVDTPGFGVRKFQSGRAIYFIKYTASGKQKKITIGAYHPGILSQTRRKAVEMLVDARRSVQETLRGIDLKLGEAIELHLVARKTEIDPTWLAEITRFLQIYWADLHDRPLRSIERGEVVRKLDVIAKERGARTADHCQKALSGLLSWSIDRGYADANPLARLKARVKGNGRTRVLSLQELVAVWTAAGDDDFGDIVKLLALTMQRKSEIGDLAWVEVDLTDERQINLPEERTKNGVAHRVPLGPEAHQILDARKRVYGRDYVFGDGQRGFQGWSKAKRRLEVMACRLRAPDLIKEVETGIGNLADRSANKRADGVIGRFGYASIDELLHSVIPHWTLHDLRRTGATLIQEFGLAEPHIVEAVLNHVSGPSKAGVAGIYNRARYEEQKRVALERWGAFVMSAVAAHKAHGFEGVKDFERREKAKFRGAI